MTVLVDTSALFALLREADSWHVRMGDWLASAHVALVVPFTVVQETAYLIGNVLGPAAEAQFLHTLTAGQFATEHLEPNDLARAGDLVEQYADFPLGFVDASIVALAERLEIRDILTTDRRHFGVVRPSHCERLRLLP